MLFLYIFLTKKLNSLIVGFVKKYFNYLKNLFYFMDEILNDESLALILRGYDLAPNSSLATKIAIYTPEIMETILTQHPKIMDKWLQKLHKEYIDTKKICDFENDPTACFNLGTYEEFEKNLKSWEEGGLIKITLPANKVIRISKSPIFQLIT
jgi:hypothetical protein